MTEHQAKEAGYTQEYGKIYNTWDSEKAKAKARAQELRDQGKRACVILHKGTWSGGIRGKE